MPKCNTVLQSESDLFEPEIEPNSPENCEFLALIRTMKSLKCFGHCSVIKGEISLNFVQYYHPVAFNNTDCILLNGEKIDQSILRD